MNFNGIHVSKWWDKFFREYVGELKTVIFKSYKEGWIKRKYELITKKKRNKSLLAKDRKLQELI